MAGKIVASVNELMKHSPIACCTLHICLTSPYISSEKSKAKKKKKILSLLQLGCHRGRGYMSKWPWQSSVSVIAHQGSSSSEPMSIPQPLINGPLFGMVCSRATYRKQHQVFHRRQDNEYCTIQGPCTSPGNPEREVLPRCCCLALWWASSGVLLSASLTLRVWRGWRRNLET